jgi:CheY-like chemotaxis protein
MALTILVIDDSATHRHLLQIHLSVEGFLIGDEDFRFLEAESAAHAFEILASERVDLIIVDIHMPDMDGIAFVRALRASEQFDLSVVPVILLTGDQDPALRAQGLSAGADVCLYKPVTRAGVLEAVKKLLDSPRERP